MPESLGTTPRLDASPAVGHNAAPRREHDGSKSKERVRPVVTPPPPAGSAPEAPKRPGPKATPAEIERYERAYDIYLEEQTLHRLVEKKHADDGALTIAEGRDVPIRRSRANKKRA